MRKYLIAILVILTINICFAQNTLEVLKKDHTIDSSKVILPDEIYKRIDQVIVQILSNYHYKKQRLNDSLSSVIFDEYIKNLDNAKSYFLKQDIEAFEKYRYQFDDFLNSGDLNIPFEIFNVYKKRLGERINYIKKCLQTEFDFSIDESFSPDREKADWAKSKEELDEIWRLRLKNDALNLILSGKDWKGAAEVLLKRYQNFHKIILQYEAEDVFSLFMNSVTQVYDPHTDYFSPAASENFSISMKLSLEGIGATLRQENDYTVVAGIVPGGPAAKSGLLHEEDKIVGVAQGEDGEMVDVIGWRLDDVIQLIRGKKGTVVRLQILKASDGPNAIPTEIKLVRDEVKLEEQAAKSEIMNIQHEGYNFKLGIIKLPSFYTDFEAQQKGKPDYKSTTRDVKEILKKFKEEKVDGVVIDLRNNGGGSLQEAIQLTGLFIKEGPVVQVKNMMNIIEVDKDPDPEIHYDGPLAVLVNRFSASASEIFSAAIQDYGRGIVIGENTYGKGTVQNLLDLNRHIPIANKKLGQLKLTIAKFYRINGSSTQHKGVQPDITFPSPYSSEEFGESSQPSALPWDQIQPAQYEKYGDLSKFISLLIKKHDERTKKDPEYQLLLDDIEEFKENRAKKVFSLNEEIRKQERNKAEERKKKKEEERAKISGIDIKDKKEVESQSSITSDYELKESARILADLILAKVG
ncbi:carboxy terminal-processing peptidase [Ignavibacteria bacterium 4148-Me]|uniref:carboxy terminal-processing peptidase n=1 Tax=Rosettibacter primus TaxID=3111523 RepID=UPI00336BFFD8